MPEEIVKFMADRVSIKPVKKDGELSIELYTGVYSVPSLADAFLWQATEGIFEVFIRRVSNKEKAEGQ